MLDFPGWVLFFVVENAARLREDILDPSWPTSVRRQNHDSADSGKNKETSIIGKLH